MIKWIKDRFRQDMHELMTRNIQLEADLCKYQIREELWNKTKDELETTITHLHQAISMRDDEIETMRAMLESDRGIVFTAEEVN